MAGSGCHLLLRVIKRTALALRTFHRFLVRPHHSHVLYMIYMRWPSPPLNSLQALDSCRHASFPVLNCHRRDIDWVGASIDIWSVASRSRSSGYGRSTLTRLSDDEGTM